MPYSSYSRHTRGPDAGPGGETVGRGRLSSKGGKLGTCICEMVRMNRTLHKKRIVTGGHWATLIVR